MFPCGSIFSFLYRTNIVIKNLLVHFVVDHFKNKIIIFFFNVRICCIIRKQDICKTNTFFLVLYEEKASKFRFVTRDL